MQVKRGATDSGFQFLSSEIAAIPVAPCNHSQHLGWTAESGKRFRKGSSGSQARKHPLRGEKMEATEKPTTVNQGPALSTGCESELCSSVPPARPYAKYLSCINALPPLPRKYAEQCHLVSLTPRQSAADSLPGCFSKKQIGCISSILKRMT